MRHFKIGELVLAPLGVGRQYARAIVVGRHTRPAPMMEPDYRMATVRYVDFHLPDEDVCEESLESID